MNYEHIKLVIDARNIATLTLDREEKHNAMDARMMQEIQHACAAMEDNPEIRAVVLTGAGDRSFSAGADLAWMQANLSKNREERIAESAQLATTLDAVNALNKLTIARVNGQAYAGAVGLICVCDIAIAVDSARFALTETRLGLTPANISPHIIARVGVANARRILLNAPLFDAEEAVQLGLIHKAVTADQLNRALDYELNSCLACAPGAIAMTKELIRRVSQQSAEENRAYTAQMLADAWEGEEAQAGINAFFKRQPPPWGSDFRS